MPGEVQAFSSYELFEGDQQALKNGGSEVPAGAQAANGHAMTTRSKHAGMQMPLDLSRQIFSYVATADERDRVMSAWHEWHRLRGQSHAFNAKPYFKILKC